MEKEFDFISDIDLKNKSSWVGKIFLTFDIDWAEDFIIEDCLSLIEPFNIKSTWFITHKSKIIKKLEKNSNIELGLHPNFNPLIEEKDSRINANDILQKYLNYVPNAVSVRSHSLVHSERLYDLFLSKGLNRICNVFLPLSSDLQIAPYKLWDDGIMIPHCFQDNVFLKTNYSFPTINNFGTQLIVLNFHPIHLFLNTENLARYEKTRKFHKDPVRLIDYRFKGFGLRNLFTKLICQCIKNN